MKGWLFLFTIFLFCQYLLKWNIKVLILDKLQSEQEPNVH